MAALGILACATAYVLPSRHIRIAAGPVGGSFFETALEYKKLIEPKGYQVDIVPFPNTNEIGAKAADDRQRLDLGFVAGDRPGKSGGQLLSLGDVQLQSMFIFENRRMAEARPIRSFQLLPRSGSRSSSAAATP